MTLREEIKEAVEADRAALARMIRHQAQRWAGVSQVAEAVLEGRHCDPKCMMCEFERSDEWKKRTQSG